MLQALKLLFMIAYTIIIFLTISPLILGVMFFCNLILAAVLRVKLKQMLWAAYKISFFIIVSFLVNILLSDISTATLILIRLIVSFSFVYPYRKTISPMRTGHCYRNSIYAF